MKYFFLLVSIICSTAGFSQAPNPELFQTWYLTSVQSTDAADVFVVADITPEISPSLTILNNLDFTGHAACNDFSGTFDSPASEFLTTGPFNQTLIICDEEIHNQFEMSYVDFMKFGGQYQIITDSNGLILKITNALMGTAIFNNYKLKSPSFEIEKIRIYTNPNNSIIFMNASQLVISEIQVINSLGQKVKTISTDFETILIAELSAGIYILKIKSDHGMLSKKFIKQ